MRVYISGAITGTDDYLERFEKAEKELADYQVLNPAAVCARLPELEYEDYMTVAFTMLSMADAIYMLPGWQQSKGANREYGYAIGKGMTIIYGEEVAPVQPKKIRRKDVEDRLKKGMNLVEIKNELGCDMTTLHMIINKYGLKPDIDDVKRAAAAERRRTYNSVAVTSDELI